MNIDQARQKAAFFRPFRIRLLLTLALLVLAGAAWSLEPDSGEKTLSPYFFVKSDDPTVDQLPLKSTTAVVNIAGVIADVLVTQTYKNEGKRAIEAVYVFPASTRAAVYGLKMTIGERTIVAQIKKRDEARQMYEDAKKQGKSASLLEQERPNVFSMNVANILPGDEIKVELSYTELLVPVSGVYEFMYPTVVGPRYTSPSQEKKPDAPDWVANPHLKAGEVSKTTFGMKVSIFAGLPIQEAICKSHKTSIAFDGKNQVNVALDESETSGGNKDFILRYRLAGGQIESGLQLFQGEKENFFLLMVQPPKEVKAEMIPPREFIFVVDVSGSMHGFPLDTAKKVMQNLLGNLRPIDYFNVMTFSGGNQVLNETSLPASAENVQKAVDVLARQRGGGGTEMLPALKRALDLPRTGQISRTMVVVTDGYVSVEKEAYELIRNRLNEGNLFAFGIGSSVNRYLIESLARAGMGEPLIVTKPEGADEQTEKFRRYIQSPVLTGVKADFGTFETYSVEPPSLPDVLAERPVILFGKWKGAATGTITLTGTSGTGEYRQTFEVASAKPSSENVALRYLWARHRIAVMSDFNALRADKEIVEEVTRLGLEYNLLTAHTSFVAIDSLVRNQSGDPATVKQPLPMPDGVSNLAMGRASPAKASSRMGVIQNFNYTPGPSSGHGGAPKPPPPPPMVRMKPPMSPSDSSAAVGEKKEKDQGQSVSQPGRITIGGVMASGRLTSDAIRKTLEKKMPDLLVAYRKALTSALGLKGKLGLELTLDQTGAVTGVKILNDELKNQALVDELVKLIKSVSFPAEGLLRSQEITLILEFNPT